MSVVYDNRQQMEEAVVLKPRRWYSSPEVNPSPDPPHVRPRITVQHLRYAARTPRTHGPVLTQRGPGRWRQTMDGGRWTMDRKSVYRRAR